jgi:integrase
MTGARTAWSSAERTAQPSTRDTFSTNWPRLLARAGLPHVRFHDLRHAHATLMLLRGVHPKIVSERLGHASVGITLDTYSHVLQRCKLRRLGPSTISFPRVTLAPGAFTNSVRAHQLAD